MFKVTIQAGIVVTVLLMVGHVAWAQECTPCDGAGSPNNCGCCSCATNGRVHTSDCCCDLWTRPTLTGDWFGRRTCLQESGITFAGR